jgi:hypothetical protein
MRWRRLAIELTYLQRSTLKQIGKVVAPLAHINLRSTALGTQIVQND